MAETDKGVRGWFSQPPRRHGEILEDRSVSPLELLYDLVFVVFVAQIARTLAVHVSARGMLDFVVLFGLVWVAWFNGTQFHELHGREDRPVAVRYLAAMCAGIALIVVSGLVDDDLRLALWALVVAGAIGLGLAQSLATHPSDFGLVVTESMVERFGQFVIIVLGEVVVGVVNGMSQDAPDARTIATGILCQGIGFGCWWTYLDFVGDRRPRTSPSAVTAGPTAR